MTQPTCDPLVVEGDELFERLPHYKHGVLPPSAERRAYWRERVHSGDFDPDRVADALWAAEAAGGLGWINTVTYHAEALAALILVEGAAYGLAARDEPPSGHDANMDTYVGLAERTWARSERPKRDGGPS